MDYNSDYWKKISKRSGSMLSALTNDINNQKDEFNISGYYQTFSKTSLHDFPKLSKAIVAKTVSEMETDGYVFQKKKTGASEKYEMSIQNVIDIYEHRKVPKYRDRYDKAMVLQVGNLKGGVSKTVSTVTLAHGLRTHPALLKDDLRILVIDLDPQGSATMFLRADKSIGEVDNTATQAMLNNVDKDELQSDYIINSQIPGVDLIPSSIDDAFIAAEWENLIEEHLPEQNPNLILKENLIDTISSEYDFIFIDNGPHLDYLLQNSLVCVDIMFTPIPPAQVDFHSTLKYLNRLPELFQIIQESGAPLNIKKNVGFMSKLAKKSDHKDTHSLAKEIFGGDMLDVSLPKLDAFEKCGASFDTVITANPNFYDGSKPALANAKVHAMDFCKSVYDRIEFIRDEG